MCSRAVPVPLPMVDGSKLSNPLMAKEMIDEAIERAEHQRDETDAAEHKVERRFRDQVSISRRHSGRHTGNRPHGDAASASRRELLKGIEASDTFAYMQAKIVRETVLKTAAATANPQAPAWHLEAVRLRKPDRAGHGIGQLQVKGTALREEGIRAAAHGEGYELGETALQMAIVLLSIALVAQSRKILFGACCLAGLGILAAAATAIGLMPSWA